MDKKRVLSGIQPTGNFHLGNYLGALKNWVDIQSQYETFYMIADLHAITVPYNPKELYENSRNIATLYLAAGIDPRQSVIFLQSEIDAHTYLAWLFNSVVPVGWLKRMTQFKDKSKGKKEVSAGLFNYPILMAADILIYDPYYVPIGEDQKQHVEFTRDLAYKFNSLYGKIFNIPHPLIKKEGARIMSLTNPSSKMSKSDKDENSKILILDSKETISRKIKKAVTDSVGTIEYEKRNRPGISNLMTIYSLITGKTISKIEKEYSGKGYKVFKDDLAEIVINYLSPIQKEYKKLNEDGQDYVDGILKKGKNEAQRIANEKLSVVRKVMGF